MENWRRKTNKCMVVTSAIITPKFNLINPFLFFRKLPNPMTNVTVLVIINMKIKISSLAHYWRLVELILGTVSEESRQLPMEKQNGQISEAGLVKKKCSVACKKLTRIQKLSFFQMLPRSLPQFN